MLSVMLLMISIADPTVGPYAADDCMGQPLQLRMADYLNLGGVASTVTTYGCSRLIGSAERAPHFGTYVVGKTRFGRFGLFGEELGFGLNVVTQPGTRIGEPDLMYATPALDLPESWQQAIDKATVPVLAVGGAVVLTSVLLGVLGH